MDFRAIFGAIFAVCSSAQDIRKYMAEIAAGSANYGFITGRIY